MEEREERIREREEKRAKDVAEWKRQIEEIKQK